MRGAHRWSDANLVRVNKTFLDVDQAIACLDFIWDEAPIIHRLVNVCLIQEVLDKDPIELSDEELQLAMHGFRRVHRLYKAEDTYRWMEQHGMTHAQLERYVADEAIVAKLRDRITAGRVETYFEEHRADFDTAYIARFAFSDEASAHHTCEQIRLGELDFYEAAQRSFVAAECSKHPSCDLFTIVQRGHVFPELAIAIFTATPGEVVGPVHTEECYVIVRVLSRTPARLDESTCNTIKRILFEQWLAELREVATIEWYWGNASRTSQVV
jgi:putative peptide maturation system protein